MDKYKITEKIEKFAPITSQEAWDCSGWIAENENREINKVMLCLTVTPDIIKQAKEKNCDMIISHHPLFYIDFYSGIVSENLSPAINIYCAHTNLDKACGGTTDVLIDTVAGKINFSEIKRDCHDFLRILELKNPIKIEDFSKIIKQISPNARLINNKKIKTLNKIAFCAGSGAEFIKDAHNLGVDCLVTGDIKFHTALDSPIVLYDIGHFESEILVLPVFEHLIGNDVKIFYAKEKSPFVSL